MARFSSLPILLLLLSVLLTINAELSIKKSTFPGKLKFLDWRPIQQIQPVLSLIGDTPVLSEDSGHTFLSLESKLSDFQVDHPTPNFGENTQGKGVREIIIHPANPEVWLFLGKGETFWITKDAGRTFSTFKAKQGDQLLGQFRFHPENPSLLIAWSMSSKDCFENPDPCPKDVSLSNDYGATWTKIFEGVFSVDWWYSKGEQAASVMALKSSSESSSLYGQGDHRMDLWEYRLAQADSKLLLKCVNFFFSVKNHLYVLWRVPYNPAYHIHPPEDKTHSLELVLMTGESLKKNESFPFLSTNLHSPSIRSFEIIESESGVFLFEMQPRAPLEVNPEIDSLKGSLWKSDLTGTKFTLSFRNIMVLNIPPKASIDFTKIHSLDGTFVANNLETTNSMATWITWNRGGMWRLAKTQEEVEGESKDQNLVLFGDFHSSSYQAHSGVYSEENAPGAIVANGGIGVEFGNYTSGEIEGDVYYSRNGGLTFKKIRNGSHLCQFLNEGSIVACIPFGQGKEIYYSFDQGSQWETVKFSEETLSVTSLDSEYGFGMALLIVAEEGENTHLISLDLDDLKLPDCVEADYEIWKASDGRQHERCIMGKEATYQRPKSNSKCYSQRKKSEPQVTPCSCQLEDFECDADFSRDSKGGCTLNPGANLIPLTACGNGTTTVSSGYRLIPGDSCNKALPGSLHLDDPKYQPCDDGADAGGQHVMEVSLGVTIPITLLALAFLASVFWYRRHRNRKYKKLRPIPME